MAVQADVATVLRDGRLTVIPAGDLVPGDVVEIAGKNFPCQHSAFLSILVFLISPDCLTSELIGAAFLQLGQRCLQTCG